MRDDRLKRLERAAPPHAERPSIDAGALSDATLSALMAVINHPDRDRKAREILNR